MPAHVRDTCMKFWGINKMCMSATCRNVSESRLRRPLKTTFDMTTLIFSTRGGGPRTLFIPLKWAPGTLFSWPVTENPSREVATKDRSSSNPRKGNPPDLKIKVDVSKADVKGFQKNASFLPRMVQIYAGMVGLLAQQAASEMEQALAPVLLLGVLGRSNL